MSVQRPLGATQSGVIQITTRAATRARSLGDRAGLLGITGLIVTTALVVVGAAHTNTLLPESVRPVPSFLAGEFAGTGINLGDYGLIAVLSTMFVSYVLAF